MEKISYHEIFFILLMQPGKVKGNLQEFFSHGSLTGWCSMHGNKVKRPLGLLEMSDRILAGDGSGRLMVAGMILSSRSHAMKESGFFP